MDLVGTDPFMMIIPPIEQFHSYYTLSTVKGISGDFRNYINVVIKQSEISGLSLNGGSLPSGLAYDWTKIADTEYYAAAISVNDGTNTLLHSSPIVTFAVYSYGHVLYESYGYPGGQRLALLHGYCTSTSDVAGKG